MELKLGIWIACSDLGELPIEPKWNWNFDWLFQIIQHNLFQSNQSGIETPVDGRIEVEGNRLPIEPKWNWNNAFTSLTCGWVRLPIEPKWNWNIGGIYLCRHLCSLPIEPKWNWNLGCENANLYSLVLPIEPKWNWNCVRGQQAYRKGCAFQSNQSGIETRIRSSTGWSVKYFQSNQSGIETTYFPFVSSRFLWLPIEPKWNWNTLNNSKRVKVCTASNRTKVELKHFMQLAPLL